MRRGVVLASLANVVAHLALLSGCSSERIRLGDGPVTTAPNTDQSNPPLEAEIGDQNDEGVTPDRPVPSPDAGSPDAGSPDAAGTGVGDPGGGGSDAGDPDGNTGAGGSPADEPNAPVNVPENDASTPDPPPEFDSGVSTSEEGGSCARGTVAGNEVVWIGDTWFTIPGTQRTLVEAEARRAGALAEGEQYVELAAPATFLTDVIAQYEQRQAGDIPVKVLIMDGGTWDTIRSTSLGETVPQVIATFEGFLDDVALDGTVQHIIYMLMPELDDIPGVQELRPGLMAACEGSTVPCHFLDLQPLWAGHPEYTGPSGIQASDAGAAVIADGIWELMQAHCIAQ